MILTNLNATTSIDQYREETEPRIREPDTANTTEQAEVVSRDEGTGGETPRRRRQEHNEEELEDRDGPESPDTGRERRSPLPPWMGRHVDISA